MRVAGLHRGESDAIVLATELGSEALLMDDGDGIRCAVAAGAKRDSNTGYLPFGQASPVHRGDSSQTRRPPKGRILAARRTLPHDPRERWRAMIEASDPVRQPYGQGRLI